MEATPAAPTQTGTQQMTGGARTEYRSTTGGGEEAHVVEENVRFLLGGGVANSWIKDESFSAGLI